MEECHFQISLAFTEDFINICWQAKQNSQKNRIFSGSVLGCNLTHLNVFIKIKWLLGCSFAFKTKMGEPKNKHAHTPSIIVKSGCSRSASPGEVQAAAAASGNRLETASLLPPPDLPSQGVASSALKQALQVFLKHTAV